MGTKNRKPSDDNHWPKELQDTTRRMLQCSDDHPRILHDYLKHIESGFAVVSVSADRTSYRLVDRSTKEEPSFPSIDDLIAAGWAID